MDIAFFSENGLQGKVPTGFPNMRTEFAWMHALNADHYSFGSEIGSKKYDVGIVILPKKNIKYPIQQRQIDAIRNHCGKVVSMQEGPNWYWQDYSMEEQVWFFNTLQEMDMILVHNYNDIPYYEGLSGKPAYVMPTLMIEDLVKDLPAHERTGVMIGGNMCSWYGGFDSMVVAAEFEQPTSVPSMGRKIPGEEQLPITHLPYMTWAEWIKTLNKFKYGVHMMRTHAAGTFALNCAYLGIPCIGYKGLDTQTLCHPELSVELGDIASARNLARKLKEDKGFYAHCSTTARALYEKHYSEEVYKNYMNEILKKL